MAYVNGKLFVGGVSMETTAEALKEHFSIYGEVEECEIRKDKRTRIGRGFGFVKFTDPSVVDRVLQDEHKILGRTVEVKRALPKFEKPQVQYCQGCGRHYLQQQPNNGSFANFNGNSNDELNTKKIFVGGLPQNLTKEEFKSFFQSFGEITDLVLMYDKENNRSRGFGFVTFESEEAVESVLKKNFHKLNDKSVEVKRAKPKERIPSHSYTYNSGNNTQSHSFGLSNCCYYCTAPYGNVFGYSYGYGGYPYDFGYPYNYHSPMSYGTCVFYPTYKSNRAFAYYGCGWSAGLVDVPINGDCSDRGTLTSVVNHNPICNDFGEIVKIVESEDYAADDDSSNLESQNDNGTPTPMVNHTVQIDDDFGESVKIVEIVDYADESSILESRDVANGQSQML